MKSNPKKNNLCVKTGMLTRTMEMDLSFKAWYQILPYIFLAFLTVLACWYFAGRHGMFASKSDWISQHSVFPDYFRQLFYETGELFPEFAPGLGGGQNIYHFSYYGLYSPVILPSYLLPSVKMSDYLMAASVVCLAASGMLFYYWLKICGFSFEICLTSAVMFLLASPMIYQSYRQVMFVSYMPFLCMALIGAERYWKTGKTGLYTAGVFLMIMTSFYFSIAGIAALMMYGMSRYRKVPWKWPFFHLMLPVLAAVCASGILLVPTAYVLISRSGASESQKIQELLLPDFSLVRFACSGYGIGLTTGIFAVLLTGLFYKDWKERLLSAGGLAVVTLPVFSWLLNGGLYVRDKALIPFLPLFCYLMAVYFQKQKQREISFWTNMAGYVLTVLWCVVSWLMQKQTVSTRRYGFLLFESGLLLVFFLIYWKRRCLLLLMLPPIFCLVLSGTELNGNEGDMLDKSRYASVTDLSWESEISGILSKEKGLYRLEQDGSSEQKKDNINRIWNTGQWITSVYSSAYQEDYQNFRQKVFQTEQPFRNQLMQSASDNPLFQKLMGVKYRIKRAQDTGTFEVTVQEHAAPVIFATDRLISREQYEKLLFPYSQTVFMQYAVTDAGGITDEMIKPGKSKTGLQQVYRADVLISEENGIQKEPDGYAIQSAKDIQASLSVSRNEEDSGKERILFVQFEVQNYRNQDVSVDINGMRNKLSAKSHIYYNGNTIFTYAVRLLANESKAEILLGKGDYVITNIRAFVSDASILAEDGLYQSKFHPDWTKTKGNCISGWINVINTGYLVTSIPYDKGFAVRSDGMDVPVQKVNTAFVGVPVSEGKHQIEIIYHAPGLRIGKLLSCIGFGLWAAVFLLGRKRGNGAGFPEKPVGDGSVRSVRL